jgi:hypothetical protein
MKKNTSHKKSKKTRKNKKTRKTKKNNKQQNAFIFQLIPTKKGKTIIKGIYDINNKFIIAAHSEIEARKMAQNNCNDECFNHKKEEREKTIPFWLDSKYSNCKVIGTSINNRRKIITSTFLS